MNLKKIKLLIVGISVVILSVGCQKDTGNESGQRNVDDAVTQVSETAESVTDSSMESQDVTETSNGISDETSNGISNENSDEIIQRLEVENNGGYFVRCGNSMYYRLQGQKSLKSNALWGEFLKNPNFDATDISDLESEIVKLDLNTLETEVFIADTGYGPLFCDGRYLYMNEIEGDDTYVKYVSLDGKEEGKLAHGTVKGCDEESGLVAVTRFDSDKNASVISLYQNTEFLKEYEVSDGFEYAGVSSDSVFFMSYNYEEGSASCYQLSTDKDEPVCLGTLDGFDAYYLCLEQFLQTDDGDYFVLSQREGTGMFVSQVMIAKVYPGVEDGLETVPDNGFNDLNEEPMIPIIYEGKYDEEYDPEAEGIGLCNVAPHTVLVGSEYEGGDLLFTYEPDAYTEVNLYFVENLGFGDSDYFQQAGEYVDGDIYVIVAKGHRTPEEDIGWRESYGIDCLKYVKYDFESDQVIELGTVEFE
ncbi:MAG: hypothetical protein K6A23_04615 [Butyrivibrio sp.]|nr:hypothetical protein [Butyrivibrio sp.]